MCAASYRQYANDPPVAEKNGFYLCEREGEGTDRYTDRETEMETQAERQAERRVLDRDS